MADLGLEELTVIHAGEHSFPMGNGIRAVALKGLADALERRGSGADAAAVRGRAERARTRGPHAGGPPTSTSKPRSP